LIHVTLKESRWWWISIEMWYRRWLYSVWSVNHAARHALIPFIALFSLWCLGYFSHMLIIEKKLVSEGMCLSAPDGHLFFIGRATVNWTSPYLFHVMIMAIIRTLKIVRIVWMWHVVMVHFVI
jgi:hypothetical protein